MGIVDLVSRYVDLKKQGRNFKGLCPFHSEKTPSFVVSPEKGLAYCFGCNQGGDIFSFLQLVESVDFVETVKRLADMVGVTLPENKAAFKVDVKQKDEKEKIAWLNQFAVDHYAKNLFLGKYNNVLEYVRDRGLTDELIMKFRLGYAPQERADLLNDLPEKVLAYPKVLEESGLFSFKVGGSEMYDRFRHRLMIPISDDRGRVVAFGGRVMDPNDQPKYLNSPETVLYNKSKTLYGLDLAKDSIRKHKSVIVVEGYFDVMAFHAVGHENVVATCGTALTEGQLRLISRFAETVCFAFDNDNAGRAALIRGVEVALPFELNLRVLDFEGKDAADMLLEDRDKLSLLAKNQGISFLDWIIDYESKQVPLMDKRLDPEYLKYFIDTYLKLVVGVGSSVLKDVYIRKFAQFLGTDPRIIYDELRQIIESRRVTHEKKVVKEPLNEAKDFVFSLSSEDLFWGYLFIEPSLFAEIWQQFLDLGPFLRIKQVYKAIIDFYNSDRNWDDLRLENLDIDADCKAYLQKIILYLELKESDVSTKSHLQAEVKLLTEKLLREVRNIRLSQLKERIKQAELTGDQQQLKELLTEYSQHLIS